MNSSDSHNKKPHQERLEKSPSEGKASETIQSTLIFSKHYHVSIMVALVTLSAIGILGYGGYRLDLLMDTKNIFMVAGLVFSFPISQFVLYKWIRGKYIPNVKKHNKTL